MYNKTLELVKKWSPRKKYSRETQYRKRLKSFLKKRLKKADFMGRSKKSVKITSESSRALADIGIAREVGIELKRNLTSQPNVDRCIGQVVRYLKDYRLGVIIVLVGKTDHDKFQELLDNVKRISRKGGILEGQRQRVWVEDKG